MTEISNVNGGSQSVALKTASARAPNESSGSIDRFAAGSKANTAPSPVKASEENISNPLEKAAEAIESFIGEAGPATKLRIDKDDDTGRFVYKSVDAESGEVVAQFPPETILEMISKFRDPEGLVVDNEA